MIPSWSISSSIQIPPMPESVTVSLTSPRESRIWPSSQAITPMSIWGGRGTETPGKVVPPPTWVRPRM